MRTYYKLEDYHWETIKEHGLSEGKEVWVARGRYDYDVAKGTVSEFDIHIEGEIEVKVKFGDDMFSHTFFLLQIHDTENGAWNALEAMIQRSRERAQSTVDYHRDTLEDIKKKRAARYKTRARK